jgi:hypothetical protein
MKVDFAVYDKSNQPVAVLEVKAVRDTDSSWAAEYRRNLLAHYGPVAAEFFGIVTPTMLYLWRGRNEVEKLSPDFEVDLSEYTKQFPESSLRGNAFEFVVSSLLNDLTILSAKEWPALAKSGLIEALQGGRVSYEAAA